MMMTPSCGLRVDYVIVFHQKSNERCKPMTFVVLNKARNPVRFFVRPVSVPLTMSIFTAPVLGAMLVPITDRSSNGTSLGCTNPVLYCSITICESYKVHNKAVVISLTTLDPYKVHNKAVVISLTTLDSYKVHNKAVFI